MANTSTVLAYNSTNGSATQFGIEPRALRLNLHIDNKGRRRGGKKSSVKLNIDDDSASEESKSSSPEEYSRHSCRRCSHKKVQKKFLPPTPAPPQPIKYFVSNTVTVDWFEAQKNCKSRGEKLATIMSKQEQENIETAIKERGLKWNDFFWIGASDFVYGGEFRWVEPETPFKYNNWADGEPNRYLNNEHCLELSFYHRWNDFKCDANKYYICQTQ